MTAPDSAHGGPVPQTPWDFPPWRRRQKGRRTNDRPPAPEGLCPLHGPALGLRPRRALPSEPHKQGSTRRTPVLCFSQFPARQRRRADTKQEPLLYLSKAVLLSSTWGAAHMSDNGPEVSTYFGDGACLILPPPHNRCNHGFRHVAGCAHGMPVKGEGNEYVFVCIHKKKKYSDIYSVVDRSACKSWRLCLHVWQWLNHHHRLQRFRRCVHYTK